MTRLLWIPILAFTISSCKKSKQPAPTNSDLTGSWKLVLITGGIASIHESTAQWGHTENCIFKPDNTFGVAVDSTPTVFSAYSLTPDPTYGGSKLSVAGQYQFNVDFVHDTLVITNTTISDATSDWYLRQ